MALVARFENGTLVKRKDSKVKFPVWFVIRTEFTNGNIALCTLMGLSGDISMRKVVKMKEENLDYV